MSEESDDLRHARLYISLDKDEMQNVIAEHKKADARRKANAAYSEHRVGTYKCRAMGCENHVFVDPSLPPDAGIPLCQSCMEHPAVQAIPAVEAVSFASVYCIGCQVLLTSQNHAHGFRCRHCSHRLSGDTWTRAHRAIRHERKLKAAVGGAWVILFYVVLAMAAAAGLGWVGATVAWHIGRLL